MATFSDASSDARRADVVVVGAGPAGCAAAITGARRGLDVVLVDKSRFPRDKACGDGLTTRALRRLDALGITPGDVASFRAVDDLRVRSVSGRIVAVPLADRGAPGVRAAVARRIDLDAALVARAQAVGVTVIDGCGAVALTEAGRRSGRSMLRVGLETAAPIETAAVIAADGAWSPLRRLAATLDGRSTPSPGAEDPAAAGAGAVSPGDWHAFRIYARDVADEAARHLWVAFSASLLPGYLWSFPLPDGQANVGACFLRTPQTHGKDLRSAWHRVLSDPFLTALLGRRAVLEGPGRSWPIPTGLCLADLSALGGRVLFAGDAAAGADPFTGEGVGQALEMGVAAGEALADLGAASPDSLSAAYARTVAAGVGVEHRISSAARSLFSTPLGARAALFGTDLLPAIRRQIGRSLYDGLPRASALAPWHWREQLAKRPAPFAGGEHGT